MDKDVIENIVSIAVVIIAWLLARIKNPDYGKKDWKCKEVRSAFGSYTIFLICIFILPLMSYFLSYVFWELYINEIVGVFSKNMEVPNIAVKIYMVIATMAIYYGIYKIVNEIKILFRPKSIKKSTKNILNVITYGPVVLNFFVSMRMSIKLDLSYFSSNITILILVFQIVAMVILDSNMSHESPKMTIVMKDGESIDANVGQVYKKGKWLRIIEQKVPHKEKLIVFDDIKSIEYHN